VRLLKDILISLFNKKRKYKMVLTFKEMIDKDFINIERHTKSKIETIMLKYKLKMKGLLNHRTSYKENDNIIQTFTEQERISIIKERNDIIKSTYHNNIEITREMNIDELNELYNFYFEYIKNYYDKSNDILKNKDENYKCDCGSIVLYKNKERHENTDKHKGIDNLNPFKYDCECGSNQIIFSQRKTHEKSLKHIHFINGTEKPKPIREQKETVKDYNCECGLKVLKSNNWKHNNSKSHLLCITINT